MKPIKILVFTLAIAFMASCTQKTPFSGKWYGSQFGCLSEVEFSPDSTMHVTSEANSSYNMDMKFVATPDGNHYNFDPVGGIQGLDAKGVAEVTPDGTLLIGINLGMGTEAVRPGKAEECKGQLLGVFFELVRDRKAIHSATDGGKDIPAEAALAFERNKRLGHGINLNGFVDDNPEDGNNAPMSAADFKSIADAGFQSVRIDTKWSAHALTVPPYTIDPAFFAFMDDVVANCFNNNIAVSLDVHYYPYINMSYPDADGLSWEENIERLKALWRQIAEHYKDYPNDMLFFDPLNEPSVELGSERYNGLISELIPIIRESNPDRTLIVMTPSQGQTWTLGELDLPKDDWNIIVQAHYYMPHTFTHNNLAYAPGTMGMPNTWEGTETEKAPLLKDLDFVSKWSKANGRPVNIGEWGTTATVDPASRVRYFTFMNEELDKRGFSYHIWSYRGVFQLYNGETGLWQEDLLKAIGQR